MNIEIVEFYPLGDRKKSKIGTLHVYVCDYDMDIRGIFVCIKNGKYYIQMPSRLGLDEEGEKVRYPILSFTNQEKNKELHKSIKEKAKEYIETNFFKKAM